MIKNWLKKIFRTNKVDSDIIKEAISDYRIQGKQLMFQLGKKYDLDINIIEDYEKLISRRNQDIPRKGKISERWNYNFHGIECGFYNKKHQQHVEVVLSNPPEFGHINSWFLFLYMQSTAKYKEKVKDINWLELKEIVNGLYEMGQVENIKQQQ